MTTFAVVNNNDLLPAVNYLLSNLDTSSGNVVLPGNVLVANTATGVVSQEGNTNPRFYLYQYINLRYSNNATGTSGFDVNSNNYSYFGVYNSATSSPSTNPTAYQWFEVSPPFNTANNRTLYYSAIGGRQIEWAAASAPPSTSYQITVANVAIDLDIVTTATGTPGERGPIAAGFVITTADPNTASSAQLTTWFEASRDAVSPPIGTGLTPVVGDTATFTWAAGAGQPSGTFSYNGSVWNAVTGQVITGNVIIPGTLSGNTITANTVTATQIANNTITGNKISANTITSNNIASGTITANNIASGTITATQIATGTITATQIQSGTITAGQIAANTITSNNIAVGTITANRIATGTITATQIAANTITSNNIATGTITANNIATQTITSQQIATNTITANNIQSNTITSNKIAVGTITALNIASNTITATNIQSGTLTTNLFTANTINGNIISSGSITTDKLAANAITANTVVSTGATLGNFNSPGFWLDGTTGNARFGNVVNIGNNLIVGANATVGGNLVISGLVTGGNLNANTVSTTTVVPLAISSGSGVTSAVTQIVAPNAIAGVYYSTNVTLNFTTTEFSQPNFIFAQALIGVEFANIVSFNVDVFLFTILYRQPIGGGPAIPLFTQNLDVNNVTNADGRTAFFNLNWTGVADVVSTPGNYVYYWAAAYGKTGTTSGITTMYYMNRNLMVQTLKR